MIPSWSDHGGLGYRCQEFAEPVEASVYFFSHHRYDKVELAIPAQQGSRLTASLKLTGDIDGLGLPSIHVRAELDFIGIIVHANAGVADIERDKQSLSRFTDASPLVGTPRGAGSLFLPATGSGQ